MSYGMTDEIFGISSAQEGKLSPWYMYGAMSVAIPGWVAGTLCGAISGNIMPDYMASALGIAIYGMFLAIVIPPAKKNSAILGVVLSAMALSWLFSVLPLLRNISSGFVIILVTLITAGMAAWLKPIEEENHEG
jgi:predicted branched-subunit amino acid permease